jgi:hypothetical protein
MYSDEDNCPVCGSGEWTVIDNYHFSPYHWQEHMLCYGCGYDEIQDFTVRRMMLKNGKWVYMPTNTSAEKLRIHMKELEAEETSNGLEEHEHAD